MTTAGTFDDWWGAFKQGLRNRDTSGEPVTDEMIVACFGDQETHREAWEAGESADGYAAYNVELAARD